MQHPKKVLLLNFFLLAIFMVKLWFFPVENPLPL